MEMRRYRISTEKVRKRLDGSFIYSLDDGAFVAYHEGETGAKTPYDLMHKLINSYAIKESSLGGEYFKIEGADCPWR